MILECSKLQRCILFINKNLYTFIDFMYEPLPQVVKIPSIKEINPSAFFMECEGKNITELAYDIKTYKLTQVAKLDPLTWDVVKEYVYIEF